MAAMADPAACRAGEGDTLVGGPARPLSPRGPPTPLVAIRVQGALAIAYIAVVMGSGGRPGGAAASPAAAIVRRLLLAAQGGLSVYNGWAVVTGWALAAAAARADKTANGVDDAVVGVLRLALTPATPVEWAGAAYVLAYATALPLGLPAAAGGRAAAAAGSLFQALLLWRALFVAWGAVRVAAQKGLAAPPAASGRGWPPARVEALLGFGRPLFWALRGLFALENAGVGVSSLVASLGVGGVAVVLATQALLTDTVCGVGLPLDRPFGVGDFCDPGRHHGGDGDCHGPPVGAAGQPRRAGGGGVQQGGGGGAGGTQRSRL